MTPIEINHRTAPELCRALGAYLDQTLGRTDTHWTRELGWVAYVLEDQQRQPMRPSEYLRLVLAEAANHGWHVEAIDDEGEELVTYTLWTWDLVLETIQSVSTCAIWLRHENRSRAVIAWVWQSNDDPCELPEENTYDWTEVLTPCFDAVQRQRREVQ